MNDILKWIREHDCTLTIEHSSFDECIEVRLETVLRTKDYFCTALILDAHTENNDFSQVLKQIENAIFETTQVERKSS